MASDHSPFRSKLRQTGMSTEHAAVCHLPQPPPVYTGQTIHGTGLRDETCQDNGYSYADDVKILVPSPSDIQKLQDALHTYEEARGAKVYIRKSRAVPIKSWNT